MRRKPLHAVWGLTAIAIALRLVAFLGRGDYVAFDEGWYLLLGINLVSGRGFTLSGLQHIALSPLFPLTVGGVNLLIDNPIWSGRLVAAVTAGLLVLPCWSIFHRLAGRRTAFLGCAFIAVMPSLAAFVAPYWIGWDLWVGAEPLFHLLLFTGLALVLRACERERIPEWLLAGVAFALAYLARPEAIIAFAVAALVVGIRASLAGRFRRLAHAAVFGLAFMLTAAPYWIYLHDVMGRWAITGRGIDVSVPRRLTSPPTTPATPSAPATIEQMLWNRDRTRYVQNLYSLDASGIRLASSYWGVPRYHSVTAPEPAPPTEPATTVLSDIPPATATELPATAPQQRQSRLVLYARALARVIPYYLWPLIFIGVLGPARTRRSELMVVLPLVLTSIAIARLVAVDPRTQLFIAPLGALYIARGVSRVGLFLDRRLRDTAVRPGFATAALAGIALTLLAGTQVRRLYMSVAIGSPHHVVGAENRRVGEALGRSLPSDATVTSWHPALALYARRDWRVLPHASFRDIVRYAHAADARYLVLSPYYPGPQLLPATAREHIVIQVPAAASSVQQWDVALHRTAEAYVVGTLAPAQDATPGSR